VRLLSVIYSKEGKTEAPFTPGRNIGIEVNAEKINPYLAYMFIPRHQNAEK
jgi:hypothetical protein